jgi:hypothetical protein
MKIIRRLLVSIVLGLLAVATSAMGQVVQGQKISGRVEIARLQVPLPPGEWEFVQSRTGRASVDGMPSGAEWRSMYLVQTTPDGRFVASLWLQLPLTTSPSNNWTTTFCERKDTLYRDTLQGNSRVPDCLLVNHITRFWKTSPSDATDRFLWDWYRSRSIETPGTVLSAAIRLYRGGDYLSATFQLNPDLAGIPPAAEMDWTRSEWNPEQINKHPERQAFVEGFKSWALGMASAYRKVLHGQDNGQVQVAALPLPPSSSRLAAPGSSPTGASSTAAVLKPPAASTASIQVAAPPPPPVATAQPATDLRGEGSRPGNPPQPDSGASIGSVTRNAEALLAEMRGELERLRSERTKASMPSASKLTARALVIGNSKYASFGRLSNPSRDAAAIARKLESFGIPVDMVLDANRAELIRTLNEYSRKAAGAEMNILFYAGHGIQVEGTNYLIPVDMSADGITAGYVKLAGISLTAVMDYLPARTRIVFLDACRDNASVRNLVASRSAGASLGLAPVTVATGTLIAYATRDGATADDGDGANSPYTAALLKHLDTPADISLVLRDVRESVLRATGGRQEPWEYGSLMGGQIILPQLVR